MISSGPLASSSRDKRQMRWSILLLIAILLVDVWYRAHTFGPSMTAATGLNLWPACIGASEPLDCDEAAYAYIGHRLLRGDVMYRDLTENKPPLGYWLYALAVALGGYDELAIRLLPIPAVLVTIALVWWTGSKMAEPVTACLAAGLYVLLSTDPYLFGNGSNMEHFMNLFSIGSLAFIVLSWSHGRRWPLVTAGVCLGAAALVKQIAVLPAAVYVLAMIFQWVGAHTEGHRWNQRLGDLLGFGLGLASIVSLVAAVLVAQGAGAAAYEDIMQYGRALATDTLREPNAPFGLVRWLTGNADPSGKLPWPFGSTNYLVWWGTGSWPLWTAAVPSLIHLLVAPGTTAVRRLVAAWTIAAGLQVVLPGLYWQHYYLLPTPGIALVVAITFADCVTAMDPTRPQSDSEARRRIRRFPPAIAGYFVFLLAIADTTAIQIRSYLLVPPQELTVRYKGGGQWVVLRQLGKELARRATLWTEPRLYVWGWQSPLHFYSKLDGVTRHFFVDNLLRDQAERDHPLIKPRIAEIVRSLHGHPPALIFVGYPPFPELRAFLRERYLPSRLVPTRSGLGLWVEREHFGEFENFSAAKVPSS
jgi:4-amino-4-deoxy-L-arabinose transferase-like glycosyltransferase